MIRSLLAALLLAAPAAAQHVSLMSEDPENRAFQEKYGYADAVITGDTVTLSGVVVGLAPGEADMVPAYDRAFRHIGSILKRAGVTWADVAEITSYHTDVKAQIDAMAAAKARYIKAPFPAWTAISVSRLLPDTGITEIRIIARRPAPAVK